MPDHLLGHKYTESHELVKKGDLVRVDDLGGLVEEVCLPGSQLASDYSCKGTGGLLIRFDDGILALLPFGHYHRITRRIEGDENEQN